MTAGAVGETAAILRERLVAIAAHKLEAAPEDIELAASRASVRGHARRRRLVRRRSPASPTSSPSRCRPACPPGLEASARVHGAHRFRSG